MRLLFYTISLAFLFSNCFRKESVDLILHNASIVSIDPMNNIYEAMAVHDGKIIALGKENQILNKYPYFPYILGVSVITILIIDLANYYK